VSLRAISAFTFYNAQHYKQPDGQTDGQIDGQTMWWCQYPIILCSSTIG